MDVARFLINDEVFRIKMVEDYDALLRITVRNREACSTKGGEISDSDGPWGSFKAEDLEEWRSEGSNNIGENGYG
ncbi:hypothetical protein RYX36_012161, partial [Vicia faba]